MSYKMLTASALVMCFKVLPGTHARITERTRRRLNTAGWLPFASGIQTHKT